MKKLIIKFLICFIPAKKWRRKTNEFMKVNALTSDFALKTDENNNSYPKLIDGLSIKINGSNNKIEIEKGAVFNNSSISINANNSHIKINKVKYINQTVLFIYNGDNQTLEIGEGTSIESARFFLCSTGGKCTIGNDCMFSSEIQIRSGDGHQIIDNETKEILNDKKISLEIGNHVWVSFGSTILKNSKIHDNSVIAAQSVVCKKFETGNIVIAGNPAKIVKNNVNWNRADPYMKKEV